MELAHASSQPSWPTLSLLSSRRVTWPADLRLQLAVRDVAYHPRLPLFASAADDATIHIYHGRVYADLLSNPLIVPLKILRGHALKDHIGVLSVVFHPTLPWVFSAAADGIIHLYTD